MDQEHKWIREIVRHGSRSASDALVRRYYDEVYAFIYRQVRDREDALDLTQESFVAALRGLPSYDWKKAGFRTWLFSIAAHKVIDARRRAGPLTVELEEVTVTDQRDFVQELENQTLLEEIEAYVCTQSTAVQETFRLHLYGGYDFPEIARLTGRTESGVKAGYYRLLKRLRKEFET